MVGFPLQEVIDVIGVDANIAFVFACLPTTVIVVRNGRTDGTPIGLILNTVIALVLYYIYTVLQFPNSPLIWISGVVELPCYFLVIWYHYFPRKT